MSLISGLWLGIDFRSVRTSSYLGSEGVYGFGVLYNDLNFYCHIAQIQ